MVTNMRDFIQGELTKAGLGTLVYVDGPKRGRGGDASWFELTIKYRAVVGGHHFDDGRIDVCIGYKNKGGYWNRRQIRRAIEFEAESRGSAPIVQAVWNSAQKQLESGRNSKGAFEL